jgi:GNAT superfamily N-acetyltransferase
VSGSGVRSRVATRTARAADLSAVLALIRQHRLAAHAEGVLTGRVPGASTTSGFERLLASPDHRVILAVLPGTGAAHEEVPVGLAILGIDPLSVVLGVPQVTVDNLVVHREHRRGGVGASLLAAAASYAGEVGADHVVAAVGGHEAERQRFFARMGFAPLTTRRIVAVDALARSLSAWQRCWLMPPIPRRPTVVARRRALTQPFPAIGAAAES